MVREGAQVICRVLEALGTEIVFGVAGSQNVNLFEAIRTSKLRPVIATDEMGSAFMALGYARASGRVATLSTIPGPGFMFALPAIVEARHDSAPIVWLSLAVDETERNFAFQKIAQLDLARPIVKKIFLPTRVEEIAVSIAEAYQEALRGEPGPVMVNIPVRLLHESGESQTTSSKAPEPVIPAALVKDVAALLNASCKPLLYLGAGAANAGELIRQLIDSQCIPVLSTSSGRGILPEDHPLSFHSDLSFGVGPAMKQLIEESDLILALGCKFTHNGTGGFQLKLPEAKLIQIDQCAENLGATFRSRLSGVAEVRAFVQALHTQMHQATPSENRRSAWETDRLDALRRSLKIEKQGPIRGEPKMTGDSGPSCRNLFEAISRIFPHDSIYVTDSGMHQALARHYATVFRPHGMICPADFQSMGLGIPGAIGAKLVSPKSEVIAVIGDGAFLMTATELLSAVREGLDLTVLVFNDGALGRIRLQQLEKFGRECGVTVQNPDFSLLAEALGATFFQATGDLDRLCQELLETSGVRILEVPLCDSLTIRKTRLKSVVRERTRSLLGAKLAKKLKSMTFRK